MLCQAKDSRLILSIRPRQETRVETFEFPHSGLANAVLHHHPGERMLIHICTNHRLIDFSWMQSVSALPQSGSPSHEGSVSLASGRGFCNLCPHSYEKMMFSPLAPIQAGYLHPFTHSQLSPNMLLAPTQHASVHQVTGAIFSHPDPKSHRLTSLRILLTTLLGVFFGMRLVLRLGNHQMVGWDTC